VDELIRKLLAQRDAVTERRAALLKTAEDNVAGDTKEKLAAHNEAMEAIKAIGPELAEIDGRLEQLRGDRDREARAAAARAGDPGPVTGRAGGDPVTVTSEPTVYGRGGRHSFFLDLARTQLGKGDGDGGLEQARDRMGRHEAELRVDLPKRQEIRNRQAERGIEDLLSGEALTRGTRRERRMAHRERLAYERFLAAGMEIYEKRFISRTPGQGGYLVPPLWLVDEYIEYLRAGRTFADLWRGFPLPSGTDSINIPRLVIGTATGPQPGDGAPVPGRDATDNFVQARVMTVAGQQDVVLQMLDQSPIAIDQVIFPDLAADYNMQVSAQLMLGSGYPQLNGLWPTGVLGTAAGPSATGFITQATGLTTAQWTGALSFYTAAGQQLSQLSRNRFLPPSGVISNPAVWYALSTSVDTTGRPIVMPAMQGQGFNAAAGDDDGPQAEGPIGHIQGVPWYLDPNIPLTFGGTGATQPYIGTISNGNTAPVQGSGGAGVNANVYTPLIAARFQDLFLWEGEMRTRVLQEVLSGTLQARFQLYAYLASMPNRYQNASNQLLSYGNVNSVGVLGAALSQGAAGGLVNF
jgi:HK97 family phage major capsid protein